MIVPTIGMSERSHDSGVITGHTDDCSHLAITRDCCCDRPGSHVSVCRGICPKRTPADRAEFGRHMGGDGIKRLETWSLAAEY